jgi:hypothetical protein
MKKQLLASSALAAVLLASGVVSAEVSLSGNARAQLHSADVFNSLELDVTDVELDVDASKSTDGGLDFSVKAEFDGAEAGGDSSPLRLDDVGITLSGGFGKIKIGTFDSAGDLYETYAASVAGGSGGTDAFFNSNFSAYLDPFGDEDDQVNLTYASNDLNGFSFAVSYFSFNPNNDYEGANGPDGAAGTAVGATFLGGGTAWTAPTAAQGGGAAIVITPTNARLNAAEAAIGNNAAEITQRDALNALTAADLALITSATELTAVTTRRDALNARRAAAVASAGASLDNDLETLIDTSGIQYGFGYELGGLNLRYATSSLSEQRGSINNGIVFDVDQTVDVDITNFGLIYSLGALSLVYGTYTTETSSTAITGEVAAGRIDTAATAVSNGGSEETTFTDLGFGYDFGSFYVSYGSSTLTDDTGGDPDQELTAISATFDLGDGLSLTVDQLNGDLNGSTADAAETIFGINASF